MSGRTAAMPVGDYLFLRVEGDGSGVRVFDEEGGEVLIDWECLRETIEALETLEEENLNGED